jgi:hypothetical protein
VVRHVLLRLLAPRHPPCALSSLTNAPVRTNLRFTLSKDKLTGKQQLSDVSAFHIVRIQFSRYKCFYGRVSYRGKPQ